MALGGETSAESHPYLPSEVAFHKEVRNVPTPHKVTEGGHQGPGPPLRTGQNCWEC